MSMRGADLRIFFGDGQIGPAQDRAIGVGRIGGGQLHKLRLLLRRRGAQLAQQIDGGGQRELRCAEAGDKIAAANAAALFESLEHVVDGAETAGDIFRGDRFAQQHAVAVEQLQGEGVAGFGCAGSQGIGLRRIPRGAQRQQRPAALRGGRRGAAGAEDARFASGAACARSRAWRCRRAGRAANRW